MKNTTNITTIAQQLRALHEKTTQIASKITGSTKWYARGGSIYDGADRQIGGFNSDQQPLYERNANAQFTAFAHNNAPAICEALEAMRWIPVSERLPENNRPADAVLDVVIEIIFHDGTTVRISTDAYYWNDDFRVKTSDINPARKSYRITHWKNQIPLPEVPQC